MYVYRLWSTWVVDKAVELQSSAPWKKHRWICVQYSVSPGRTPNENDLISRGITQSQPSIVRLPTPAPLVDSIWRYRHRADQNVSVCVFGNEY